MAVERDLTPYSLRDCAKRSMFLDKPMESTAFYCMTSILLCLTIRFTRKLASRCRNAKPPPCDASLVCNLRGGASILKGRKTYSPKFICTLAPFDRLDSVNWTPRARVVNFNRRLLKYLEHRRAKIENSNFPAQDCRILYMFRGNLSNHVQGRL
jgi:hypothetical protein